MTAKHTPGPWHAVLDGGDGRIIDKSGNEIADCGFGNSSDKANARLIAAAPDMLEALREIVREGYATGILTTNGLDHARSAIEKAVGQ